MYKRNPTADLNATRRKILIGGAGIAAAISLPMAALAAETKPARAPASRANNQGRVMDTQLELWRSNVGLAELGKDNP